MPSTTELLKISTQVRRDIIRMTHGASSGHPGGSLGCADFLTTLYFGVMKPDPKNFTLDGIGEDLFFLSNGHISPVWYSVLGRYGYFDYHELGTFRMLHTRLQGHPSVHERLPGIRMASGSLGQGLSVACGAALTKKLNKDPHHVFCLMGDGELEEGQNWEAVMFAAARKVDNLIAIVDENGQQIDGPTEAIIPQGDLKAKFEAFGWVVIRMNGNDIADIREKMALAKVACCKEKPVMVLMKTSMGYGVDFMLNDHGWHGVAPNDKQAENALSQLEETLGDY
jgi:transketolase